MTVLNVAPHHQIVRFERHPSIHVAAVPFDLHLAARRSIGAGKERKKVVKAAIFLNDQHDVRDRRASRSVVHAMVYRLHILRHRSDRRTAARR